MSAATKAKGTIKVRQVRSGMWLRSRNRARSTSTGCSGDNSVALVM